LRTVNCAKNDVSRSECGSHERGRTQMVMQLGRRLGSAEAREILGCALQKREKGGGGQELGASRVQSAHMCFNLLFNALRQLQVVAPEADLLDRNGAGFRPAAESVGRHAGRKEDGAQIQGAGILARQHRRE